MTKAIIGKKLGMTQLFTPDGTMVAVTVVEAGPCVVSQVKNNEKDGYTAVQLAYGDVKQSSLNKPALGHLKKAGINEPKKVLKEFRFDDVSAFDAGKVIKCDIFATGDKVDVSGITKGRGFSGAIKRWNTHRLKMSHGTGPVHREVGSMGANSSPSRVFKNKKMAGQYGHEKVTIQNLEIVKVDPERNLLLIRGALPGPKGSLLTVKQTVKKAK